jgi:peptidoglycan/LPS O-acetylase OafA/YrhL
VCVSANFLGAQQPAFGLRWLSLLYGTLFGMALVCATKGQVSLMRILGNPVLAFMGKIGFGLYLLHFPVFQAVNATIDAGPAIRLAVAMPIVVGLAWLAYNLVERPMISLGRKLEVRLGVSSSRTVNAEEGRTKCLSTNNV